MPIRLTACSFPASTDPFWIPSDPEPHYKYHCFFIARGSHSFNRPLKMPAYLWLQVPLTLWFYAALLVMKVKIFLLLAFACFRIKALWVHHICPSVCSHVRFLHLLNWSGPNPEGRFSLIRGYRILNLIAKHTSPFSSYKHCWFYGSFAQGFDSYFRLPFFCQSPSSCRLFSKNTLIHTSPLVHLFLKVILSYKFFCYLCKSENMWRYNVYVFPRVSEGTQGGASYEPF